MSKEAKGKEPENKSQIMREWINAKLEANYDYSNTESRMKDFKEFLESHKSFSYENHRSLFFSILRSCCITKGLDPATFGLKRSTDATVKKNNDMKSTITPKPKVTNNQNPQQKPEQKTNDAGNAGDAGQTQEQKVEITIDLVKYTCKLAYGIVQTKYRNFSPLTEDESMALANAWLPIFQEYLQKDWMKWGMPIFITGGILLSKAKEATPEKKPEERRTGEMQKEATPEKKPEEKKKDNSSKMATGTWLEKIGLDEKSFKGEKS